MNKTAADLKFPLALSNRNESLLVKVSEAITDRTVRMFCFQLHHALMSDMILAFFPYSNMNFIDIS
jgi:hypothetical protein